MLSTPSQPAARSQSVSCRQTSLDGTVDLTGRGERSAHARHRGAVRPARVLDGLHTLGHEPGRQVVGVEEPPLRRDVGRRRDAGVPGDVPDEVRLVVPAEVGGQPRPRHPVGDVDLLQQPAHAQHPGQRARAQPDDAGELPVEVAVRDAERRRPRRRPAARASPRAARRPRRSGPAPRSDSSSPARSTVLGAASSVRVARPASRSAPQRRRRPARRRAGRRPGRAAARGRRRTPPGSRSGW